MIFALSSGFWLVFTIGAACYVLAAAMMMRVPADVAQPVSIAPHAPSEAAAASHG
jgi:hypothetical protein